MAQKQQAARGRGKEAVGRGRQQLGKGEGRQLLVQKTRMSREAREVREVRSSRLASVGGQASVRVHRMLQQLMLHMLWMWDSRRNRH